MLERAMAVIAPLEASSENVADFDQSFLEMEMISVSEVLECVWGHVNVSPYHGFWSLQRNIVQMYAKQQSSHKRTL